VHGELKRMKDYDSLPLFFSSVSVTNKSGNPSIFISPYLILPLFGNDESTGVIFKIL
jgi:hypothetical protein